MGVLDLDLLLSSRTWNYLPFLLGVKPPLPPAGLVFLQSGLSEAASASRAFKALSMVSPVLHKETPSVRHRKPAFHTPPSTTRRIDDRSRVFPSGEVVAVRPSIRDARRWASRGSAAASSSSALDSRSLIDLNILMATSEESIIIPIDNGQSKPRREHSRRYKARWWAALALAALSLLASASLSCRFLLTPTGEIIITPAPPVKSPTTLPGDPGSKETPKWPS